MNRESTMQFELVEQMLEARKQLAGAQSDKPSLEPLVKFHLHVFPLQLQQGRGQAAVA